MTKHLSQPMKTPLVFILLIISNISLAKIVDVSVETTKANEEGLSLLVKGTYDSAKGNSNREFYSGMVTARYGWSKHQILLMGSSEWGVLEGRKYLESDFVHSRYRYHILDWLDWGLFAQVDRNRFRGLSKRSLLGTGPRLSLIQEGWQAYWGLFVMNEKEEYLEGIEEDRIQQSNRISTFISFKIQPMENVTIFSTNYYQPKVDDSSDYRLLSNSGISLAVSKQLSFDWKLHIVFDSDPPNGIEKQDRRITQGLTYSL